ncbi:hypothetical protein Fcan01_16281 [Folsomia candida]|uniref:Secreted protein n=1 Tax=Folsomia candida TaxID=158441 RepID=A0A226DV55_FOLCA|nr:hypothetical protein Fcan01_16281 [Folsomia candida]
MIKNLVCTLLFITMLSARDGNAGTAVYPCSGEGYFKINGATDRAKYCPGTMPCDYVFCSYDTAYRRYRRVFHVCPLDRPVPPATTPTDNYEFHETNHTCGRRHVSHVNRQKLGAPRH